MVLQTAACVLLAIITWVLRLFLLIKPNETTRTTCLQHNPQPAETGAFNG